MSYGLTGRRSQPTYICTQCCNTFYFEDIINLGNSKFICINCDKELHRKPKEIKTDSINHPSHYTTHPSGIECIQITEHMNFNIGNSIKYLWRAGIKSDKTHIEDLKKAIWYINREIERLEKANK